ncbi:competence protein CoiA [Metabacillus indicus]|uniref:competence protein CoiA n=1 Tax=Metabacillus indicus TaxID=246786 RepID=UPI00398440CD
MLRCITSDEQTLISSNCNVATTRKLSTKKELLCPNCKTTVIFKAGKVKRPHFAHHNSECVAAYHEPETDSHVKGKEILFNWLKNKYPTSEIQYEVYIPETKQIADVFVKHTEEGMEGLRWAFEFQHSPLSSTEWNKRHELYQSEDIQDFWILDKAKYMKFSTAKDVTNARLRKDLETTIFSETGLCYFLDLGTTELTIDFHFYTSYEKRIIKRMEIKTPYTYHRPIHHSCHIDQVRIRMNDKFKYGVFVYEEIESQMEPRLSLIINRFIRNQKLQLEQEFKEQAIKKKTFAKSKYGEDAANVIVQFIEKNKEELDIRIIQEVDIRDSLIQLIEDVRIMQEHDFFEKYNELIEKLLLNLQEFKKVKDSNDLIKKLMWKINYSTDIYKLSFLIDQDTQSLQDYLISKDQDKISLVEYVYTEYKEVLEKLASMNPKYIYKELGKIKSSLTVWGDNPTALDYAIEYHWLKSKDEIDEYIEQIKEKIIKHKPFNKFIEENEWN